MTHSEALAQIFALCKDHNISGFDINEAILQNKINLFLEKTGLNEIKITHGTYTENDSMYFGICGMTLEFSLNDKLYSSDNKNLYEIKLSEDPEDYAEADDKNLPLYLANEVLFSEIKDLINISEDQFFKMVEDIINFYSSINDSFFESANVEEIFKK
jgi:hypothetical protein